MEEEGHLREGGRVDEGFYYGGDRGEDGANDNVAPA